MDLVCICPNRSRNVRRAVETEAARELRASNPKPPTVMPKLVAPDGIVYVIKDTEPGQGDLAERRPDLPPKKNLNQLLGWCGPAGVTSQTTGSYWRKSRGPRMMVSTFCSSVPPLVR